MPKRSESLSRPPIKRKQPSAVTAPHVVSVGRKDAVMDITDRLDAGTGAMMSVVVTMTIAGDEMIARVVVETTASSEANAVGHTTISIGTTIMKTAQGRGSIVQRQSVIGVACKATSGVNVRHEL